VNLTVTTIWVCALTIAGHSRNVSSTARLISGPGFSHDHTRQRWARIRNGSGRKPILVGSGLDRIAFFYWRIRTGSDWENYCCINV